MTAAIVRAMFLVAIVAAPGSAQGQRAWGPRQEATPHPFDSGTLIAALSDDLASGELLAIRRGPPWTQAPLHATAGGRRLRRFGRAAWLVHPEAGSVQRLPLQDGDPRTYDLGPASAPQDVLLHPSLPASTALVTLRNHPRLVHVSLVSGATTDGVDLTPVGGGAEIALGTMIADGDRLFVQVKIEGDARVPNTDTGALAVVDLATNSLVDVDPIAPGIQGVALEGAPPRLEMQIVEETRTLFVSTTDGMLDSRGGIEMVDLDALVSTGLAVSELQTADVGGFVLTSPEGGYFIFHTDFAASTHVSAFTVAGGPTPGPELLLFLGDQVDVLVHDPAQGRLYLPSRFAGGPKGIYVLDTATNLELPASPIVTPMAVHDLVVR